MGKFIIKPKEIYNIIKQLKPSKASGADKINNKIIKNLPKKAVIFLCIIFNCCIRQEYFPSCWKSSLVVPIGKPNKDPFNPKSYRPIHLLNSISKIFEKAILMRINEHIENNNVIPNVQFGFRRGHSTCHQLFRLASEIKDNLYNKKSVGIVSLDIEKAFDTVWHKALLFKR